MPSVQRWQSGRHHWRPVGERLHTSAYDVAPIAEDRVARAFVLQHHYSGSYPSARYRFGLYRGTELEGVAVFSHPTRNEVLTNVFPGDPLASVELGRFILLDRVPGNGETWFLGRCFELLRGAGLVGVVSFADPQPRAVNGRLLFPGHVGTIYQAHNGVWQGRSKARTLRMFPDGRVWSDRAQTKIVSQAKGWRYAAAMLEERGAPPVSEAEDTAAWVRDWRDRLTVPVRHAGNHRYCWDLTRTRRFQLRSWGPYPKQPDPQEGV